MSGLVVVANAFVEVDKIPGVVGSAGGLGCKSWPSQSVDSSWGFRAGCRGLGCT